MCQADIEVNHVQQGEDSRTPDPSLLTAYPIALYTATLVAYIIYAVNQDPFFLQSRGGSKHRRRRDGCSGCTAGVHRLGSWHPVRYCGQIA